MNQRRKLILTPGEPSGIGPDIVVKLAHHALPITPIVVGCPQVLETRAKQLGLPITLHEVSDKHWGQGHLYIVPIATSSPVVPGQLNEDNAPYVRETLNVATQLCLEHGHALVTGPVHKGILTRPERPFTGHTEYLAKLCGVPHVLMTFYNPSLILGLATTHMPLSDVPTRLTQALLARTLTLFAQGLQTCYGISHPKILCLGLNPHAGEGGLLGHEEQDIVHPVLAKLREQGWHIEGPHPGDTAFNPDVRSRFDALFALYHDQGLGPMKALFFGDLTNVTLGLPFIRTSVDHGVALDLAGTGKARETSLLRAYQVAHTFISKESV